MMRPFNADVTTVYVLTDMLGSSVNNNMVELSKERRSSRLSAVSTSRWRSRSL